MLIRMMEQLLHLSPSLLLKFEESVQRRQCASEKGGVDTESDFGPGNFGSQPEQYRECGTKKYKRGSAEK